MTNKAIISFAVMSFSVATLLTACASAPATAGSTGPQARLVQATGGLATQYRTHCRVVCRVHLSFCVTEGWQNTGRVTDCRSKCNDGLIACACAGGDRACLAKCKDKYFGCMDDCPPYTASTACGSKFNSCMDRCDEAPECLSNADCGPNGICSSAHRCFSAPACVNAASCPKDDTYGCYDGHCIAM